MTRAFVAALLLMGCAGTALAEDVLTGDSPGEPPTPAPAVPPAPPPPPPAWLPRAGADLVALDKVSARSAALFVAVGQTAQFGAMTVGVRACVVRPPDHAADATAFLDVTDPTPGAPQFHGWIIRSAPAVSGLQHPIYDLRLSGCR